MNMVESILSETESSLDRQWRDMEFCYEVMEQHREMEKFVNECLIMSSGNKKAINEMYILNEAAFGDKIKAFFEKIKNFFKKIFDKLGASMSALFSEQKKYMEKYAYIITKCKWQGGDVSDIKDYFKGVPRITAAVDESDKAIFGTNLDKYFGGKDTGTDPKNTNYLNLNSFESAENINNLNIEKKDISVFKNEAYDAFTGAGTYWENKEGFTKETDSSNNPDINATFKAYFDGSKDTISLSGDEIEEKFQMIINVTYAGQSYLNKLEKLVTTVNKKMDEASKNMEDYYKTQKDKIMAAVKQDVKDDNAKTNDVTTTNKIQSKEVPKDPNNPDGEKKTVYYADVNGKHFEADSAETVKTQATNAGVKGLAESYSYLIESPSFSNSSSSASEVDNKAASQSYTGTGVGDVKKTTDANDKASKQQANKMTSMNMNKTSNVTDANKDAIAKKANEQLDNDIHNRQARINADIQISSTIVRSMFAGFKDANSNFWSIIQHHVQWYLGNPGSEKASENQASRPKNLDINGGISAEKPASTSNNNGNASAG